jgi:periplasmic protein TonB
MKYVLVSARGRKQGLQIPINEKIFVVGSSPRNQIRSVQQGVGDRHCAFVLHKNRLYLQDLGSGHPTHVNGTTMTPGSRLVLQSGDRVALGPMEFVVRAERPAVPVATPYSAPPTWSGGHAGTGTSGGQLRPVTAARAPQAVPVATHAPLDFAPPPRNPHHQPGGLLTRIRTGLALAVLALICMGVGWLVFQGPRTQQEAQNEGASSEEQKVASVTPGPNNAPVVPERPILPPKQEKPGQDRGPNQQPPPVQKPVNPEPEKPVAKQPPKEVKPPMPNPMPKPVKPPEPPSQMVAFEPQIKPIFEARCAYCHNDKKKRGGLDLSTVASLLKGGDTGPAVVPGKLDKSPLWEALDSDRMPPAGKPLTAEQKKLVRDWILGARNGQLASR